MLAAKNISFYSHSMQLSPTQDYIISRLKNASTLRYRDMRPDDMANDLYNYHLRALLRLDLVEKASQGYRLSASGRRYVADMHHTSDVHQRLFKINVILIVARTTPTGIEILNQHRTAQPSYGKIGVPGGTIVKGEPLLEGATRKLREETGLSATFRHICQERRMQYHEDELFSDILFPVCYADTASGKLVTTDYGEAFWCPIDQAIDHESDPHDSIESIRTVLAAIRDGSLETLPFSYRETIQYS